MSTTEITSATATARFLGRCDTCDRPVAFDNVGTYVDHVQGPCPDCGGTLTAQRLYGTLSVEHCNGACEGATGPDCTCACGGVNHGGAWAKPGTMLADELAAYRTKRANRQAGTDKRRQARLDAEKAERAAAIAAWTADHGDVVEYLTTGDIAWSGFLTDLAERLAAGRELSARQVESVRRNIARQAERAAKKAAEAARPATAAPPVGARKLAVAGEVTYRDSRETEYGWRHTMTVRADDGGYLLRTTIPGALLDIQRDDYTWGPAVGDRVEFVAGEVVATTWENAPAGFAEVKRPTKARILTEAAA